MNVRHLRGMFLTTITMPRSTDGEMDGWMDGWMDACMYSDVKAAEMFKLLQLRSYMRGRRRKQARKRKKTLKNRTKVGERET